MEHVAIFGVPNLGNCVNVYKVTLSCMIMLFKMHVNLYSSLFFSQWRLLVKKKQLMKTRNHPIKKYVRNLKELLRKENLHQKERKV